MCVLASIWRGKVILDDVEKVQATRTTCYVFAGLCTIGVLCCFIDCLVAVFTRDYRMVSMVG